MIQVGIDLTGSRVHINNYDGQELFCQGCGGKLTAVKGAINTHHYRHLNGCECSYGGKTSAHLNFQLAFPDNCVEYVLYDSNGEKHIADVKYNNTIIEYQHSPISIEEVVKRTNFYTLEHELYWVFDRRSLFNKLGIEVHPLGGKDFELEYDYKRFKVDYLLFSTLNSIRTSKWDLHYGSGLKSRINICFQYNDNYILYPTSIQGNIFKGWRFTLNSFVKFIEYNEKKHLLGKMYFTNDNMTSLFD